MTNREVGDNIMTGFDEIDIEDKEELRQYLIRAVNYTRTKLGIPEGMASRYVYNLYIGYQEELKELELMREEDGSTTA